MAFVDKWDQDIKQLYGDGSTSGPGMGDLNFCLEAKKGLDTAVTAYHDFMDSGWKKIKDPMALLMMMSVAITNLGSQQMNYQLAVDGAAVKVQSGLTSLSNDLHDLTNQDDDAGQTGSGSYLNKAASRSEDMYNRLTKDPALRNVLGSAAADSLADNFLTLRHQIHTGGALDGKGDEVIFDATGADPNKVHSYQEFHKLLGERDDKMGCNEGLKTMTDAFNQNTSTLQSTNAASQEMISNDTNKISAITTTFGGAILHGIQDLTSSIIKHMGQG